MDNGILVRIRPIEKALACWIFDLRVTFRRAVKCERSGNLRAGHGVVEGAEGGDDGHGGAEDETLGDDGAKLSLSQRGDRSWVRRDLYVEPGSEHPLPMLVDLETLDVDPCEGDGERRRNYEYADS